MPKLGAKLSLGGKSKQSYSFDLFTPDTDFKESWGGVYVFSNRHEDNGIRHTILYVGKANSFNQRFDSHEKWEALRRAGANCIGILKVDKEADMLRIEEDLIKEQKPGFNTVHNR